MTSIDLHGADMASLTHLTHLERTFSS